MFVIKSSEGIIWQGVKNLCIINIQDKDKLVNIQE